MNDGQGSWWLGADRTWHRGTPPTGWRQGGDGRWHAPDHTTDELPIVGGPAWTDPTALSTQPVPVMPARHLTPDLAGPRRRLNDSSGTFDLSPWMKAAVPALTAVIVLMTAGVFVTASSGTDRDLRPSSEGLGVAIEVPGSGAAAPAAVAATPPLATDTSAGEATEPASPASTTPPAPTSTTTAPSTSPTTAPADPLAACSPGQRMAIERGNHPLEWYVARFDQDGDGIFCT
jgi:hypothetical protein